MLLATLREVITEVRAEIVVAFGPWAISGSTVLSGVFVEIVILIVRLLILAPLLVALLPLPLVALPTGAPLLPRSVRVCLGLAGLVVIEVRVRIGCCA